VRRFREAQPSDEPVLRMAREAAQAAHRATYEAGFKAGIEETLNALEARFPEMMPRTPARAREMASPERARVVEFIAETRRRLEAEDG
jgi:hypothetical protein